MNETIRITSATSFDGYSAPDGVVASIQRLVDQDVLTCQFDSGPNDDGHNASLLAPLVQPDGKPLWRVTAERVEP